MIPRELVSITQDHSSLPPGPPEPEPRSLGALEPEPGGPPPTSQPLLWETSLQIHNARMALRHTHQCKGGGTRSHRDLHALAQPHQPHIPPTRCDRQGTSRHISLLLLKGQPDMCRHGAGGGPFRPESRGAGVGTPSQDSHLTKTRIPSGSAPEERPAVLLPQAPARPGVGWRSRESPASSWRGTLLPAQLGP